MDDVKRQAREYRARQDMRDGLRDLITLGLVTILFIGSTIVKIL